MNVFTKLTFRTLKYNRTRTLVTILGVILSAAMFTAVTTLISSFQSFAIEMAIESSGNWHGVLFSSPGEAVDALRSDERVESLVVGEVVGYAEIPGSENSYRPYIFIRGVEEEFLDTMSMELTVGRMPDNPSEIILPESLLQGAGVNFSIGDSLALETGTRIMDGSTLWQNDALQMADDALAEELVTYDNKEYTVVGFFEQSNFESYAAPGYSAFTAMDDAGSARNGFDVFFRLDRPADIFDVLGDYSDAGIVTDYNSGLLMYLGVSGYESFYSVLYSLAAILMALIMFSSVSLIYNAFAMSVSERTKQFGLLSSVGATRKQLRGAVFSEAMFVGIIGIPVGILSGILGIGITLHFISGIFSAFLNAGASMELHVSWAAVAVAFTVSAVTLLISALIPSKRAAKVSAIESIRQTQDIAVRGKDVRTSPLLYRAFGLEGMLSRKNYKRDKRKYRATVLSLFMSIVLFITASSFCMYLTESVSGVMSRYDYDLTYYFNGGSHENGPSADETYTLLSRADKVTESGNSEFLYAEFRIDPQYISERFKALDALDALDGTSDEFIFNHSIAVVDDETFLKYLEKNGLDKSVYFNKENPVLIAGAHVGGYNSASGRYETVEIYSVSSFTLKAFLTDRQKIRELGGEELDLLYQEGRISEYQDCFTLNIGLCAEELPFGLNSMYGSGYIVIPRGLLDSVIPDYDKYSYEEYSFYFSSGKHSETFDSMVGILRENELSSSHLVNIAESEEANRGTIVIINVFSYGFIVLISLIAAANVFNTILTNIRLRRREFAILRSIGMTTRSLMKMMNYECLMNGLRAILYGLPVSVAATYAIYRSIVGGWETGFTMPWPQVVLAVLSVFAVVFATMILSMSKIKKDNPIDALKNENL